MTPGVDFFRVDRSRHTRTRLSIAGVLVAIGGTIVGAHLIHRLGNASAFVSLGGGIVLLTGLLLGFGTMALLLFENVWLAIRDEGILLHDNGAEEAIAWGGLREVVVRDGHVVFRRDDGGERRWYAGRDASAVAARVEEAKRKGALGIPIQNSNR